LIILVVYCSIKLVHSNKNAVKTVAQMEASVVETDFELSEVPQLEEVE
jgi:hypothetical protein